MNEKQIYKFCNQYYSNIQRNNKTLIPPYQLDIVIPQLRLAIEVNGAKFHSIENGIDKFYHQRKLQLCQQINYELFMIDQLDLVLNKQYVFNKLLSKFIVNKKQIINPTIKIIDSELALEFLKQNSININLGQTTYGLFSDNSLIACFSYTNENIINYICLHLYDDVTCLKLILQYIKLHFRIEIERGKLLETPFIKNKFKIKGFKNPNKRIFKTFQYFNCGYLILDFFY